MAEEKITFSYVWYKELQPIEWLQYIADDFSSLANLWDEYNPNYFEETFEYHKEDPDFKEFLKNTSESDGKMAMYEEVSHGVGERLLHSYFADSRDVILEIEHLMENILKAFEGCIVFPNLLKAIGIIEDVKKVAFDTMNYYAHTLYYKEYLSAKPTQEDIELIIKGLDINPQWAKRLTEKHELTADDYEEAFEYITELLETIEKGQFYTKLRESSWAIKGYCKLKAGSEKYAEIEAKITKRKRGRNKDPKVRRRNKEIAKYRVNNPRLSWTEVGHEFDVSADIARKACNNPDN